MPRMERVKDRWKHLREGLYGNVEPMVRIEGITMPIAYRGDDVKNAFTCYDSEVYGMEWRSIEIMPALAAGISYGSRQALEIDPERCFKLNKGLIKKGHHTPLESIQINFAASGISKTCGAQVSRHRIGQGHVGASRRFKDASASFVYPTYDHLSLEDAIHELTDDEEANRYAYAKYEAKRSRGMTKQDARGVLPVSYATERSWWINVRAIRDFFRLRLAADAEWEIRRFAWMMFDLVQPLLPSLFEDIKERADEASKENETVSDVQP